MSKSAYDNSGDNLHHIANIFSDSVGILLKQYYPARIRSVVVDLNFDQNTKKFTLDYYAEIERCKFNEYDYYFEHAGALSADSALSTARKDAFSRMKQQESERQEKFKKAFGNFGSKGYHFDSATSGDYRWVIYETFIVAK